MSPAERALLARIRRRSMGLQPEAARRLLAAYDLIRDSLSEAELLRALHSGSLDQLLTDVLRDDALEPSLARLRQMVDVRTLEASRSWATTLPSSLRGTFGVLNPLVVQAIRTLDREVTTRIAVEVRESVRTAVEVGVRAGQNPRVSARTIRSAIGLSPNQVRWVENFRAQLLAGDRRALSRVLGKGQIRTPSGAIVHRAGHAAGQGLSKRDLLALDRLLGTKALTGEQVDRMVESYRKRLLALNAEAHARSIALDANRLAQRLSWEDAVARGVIGRNQIRRTWIAVGGPQGDGRNRPEHLELHGTTVGWDSPYPNGEVVPGEHSYNCRCIERMTVVPAVQLLAA